MLAKGHGFHSNKNSMDVVIVCELVAVFVIVVVIVVVVVDDMVVMVVVMVVDDIDHVDNHEVDIVKTRWKTVSKAAAPAKSMKAKGM